MRLSETTKQNAYPHRVRKVGAVASQRQIKHRNQSYLSRTFLAMEYGLFVFIFYLLMAIKVLPEYPQLDRFNPMSWIEQLPVFNNYALFLLIFILVHIFAVVQKLLFSGKAEHSYVEQFMFNIRAIVYAFLITLGITFMLKTTALYSRVTLMLFICMILLGSLMLLSLKRIILNNWYKSGELQSHVLIVGAGRIGTSISQLLVESKERKYNVVGYLDDYKQGEGILGKTPELEKIIQKQKVDIVYITIPSERHIIESMLHTVYKYDIDIRIIPEMFDRMSTVFEYRSDLELPCLQIVKTPLRGMNVVFKRLSDILGSSILLVLLSPLFLILAVWIKCDSRGDIFFRQLRVGKNGVPFHMLKFRSMRQDADRYKQMLSDVNEASGPVFKIRNDPRVTRIGQYLRKYSLDELPQLWNVLKGEMSLIGPRPPLPTEVERYTDYHWRRMDVLPGMTGLWQVSGRSNLDFEEWIDLDIFYIERWSFLLEMKILLKTIPVVIKGTGAY